MNGLDQFESLAEQLVEGTFERLFRPRLHPSEVARRLARAMEDAQIVTEGGKALLPNHYWVFLNPDDFASLDGQGDALRDELLRYLRRLAHERGARFGGQLRVAVYAVTDLGTGQLEVRAAHVSEAGGVEETQGVKVAARSADDARRWSLHLGGHNYPLGEPVIRLGRSLSNDVIVEDGRISRQHAQLRWRAGSYYLSDLGSRGGTSHNDRPVRQGQEVPLAPGDVISLAGVTLVVQGPERL